MSAQSTLYIVGNIEFYLAAIIKMNALGKYIPKKEKKKKRRQKEINKHRTKPLSSELTDSECDRMFSG